MGIEQSGPGRVETDGPFESPRLHCFCGGTYRLDTQYLVDAERYALTRHVPILWRCQMCGRSLVRAGEAAFGANLKTPSPLAARKPLPGEVLPAGDDAGPAGQRPGEARSATARPSRPGRARARARPARAR
jgi:hypothetical protein